MLVPLPAALLTASLWDAGPEAGRRTGPGARHVPGGDPRRGAPQLRVGGLGSKTGDSERHPDSSRQQGAAGHRAPG